MFTGIVETVAEILDVQAAGQNKIFTVSTPLAAQLSVDQSVSHNGVCLTVENVISPKTYRVSAIAETLDKTTLGDWNTGEKVNLERAVSLHQRLDGHLVQGHVDRTLLCLDQMDREGSLHFTFELPAQDSHLIIPHGSITLDGISLTVAELSNKSFSVAIIPYTLEHTVAQWWEAGTRVNVEYDVFGKYLARYRQLYHDAQETNGSNDSRPTKKIFSVNV